MFTHARSRSGGGAGAKSAPQEMGPTPNLPRPLRNRQRNGRSARVRSASAPRMCEHTRGSVAGMTKSARLRSATVPRMCERSFNVQFGTQKMGDRSARVDGTSPQTPLTSVTSQTGHCFPLCPCISAIQGTTRNIFTFALGH